MINASSVIRGTVADSYERRIPYRSPICGRRRICVRIGLLAPEVMEMVIGV